MVEDHLACRIMIDHSFYRQGFREDYGDPYSWKILPKFFNALMTTNNLYGFGGGPYDRRQVIEQFFLAPYNCHLEKPLMKWYTVAFGRA